MLCVRFEFLGLKLVSWRLIGFRVKETSNLNSDGSIESGTSILVGLHMCFVFTGFRMNPERLVEV